MKTMKVALLATAALAAVSVSARADDTAAIKAQLEAFASDVRRNDTNEQMRNIARGLTPQEIEEAANYYASQPPASGAQR
jgi:cytochrome c553